MINILIRYYNTIIKQQYYPKWWLKILEVMIEKGKGAKLGKLRIIQLIEADLQMIMRLSMNSKYSIETAILQKGWFMITAN